jgi:hypothetical protein
MHRLYRTRVNCHILQMISQHKDHISSRRKAIDDSCISLRWGGSIMYHPLSHEDKLPPFYKQSLKRITFHLAQSDRWLLYLAVVRRPNHVRTLWSTRENCHILQSTAPSLSHEGKLPYFANDFSTRGSYFISHKSDRWLLYLAAVRRLNHVPTSIARA